MALATYAYVQIVCIDCIHCKHQL